MEVLIAVAVAFVIANYFKVILAYVGVGLLYTFIKWTLSLVKLRRKVLTIDADMIKRRRIGYLSEQPESATINSIRASMASHIFSDGSYPPVAKNNLGLITAWALFWPINLVWTMFADVLTEIWSWLTSKFVGVYQAISNSILPK